MSCKVKNEKGEAANRQKLIKPDWFVKRIDIGGPLFLTWHFSSSFTWHMSAIIMRQYRLIPPKHPDMHCPAAERTLTVRDVNDFEDSFSLIVKRTSYIRGYDDANSAIDWAHRGHQHAAQETPALAGANDSKDSFLPEIERERSIFT